MPAPRHRGEVELVVVGTRSAAECLRTSRSTIIGDVPPSRTVYEYDPERAPDDDFEPGVLAHAVVGNEGRMLDPRRTPVRVVDVRPVTGHVVLEVTAFEDEGAHWDIELERLGGFQFAKGGARAEGAPLVELEEAVRRLDRALHIAVEPGRRERTDGRLESARRDARSWLGGRRVRIDLARRAGDPANWELLSTYLGECGVLDVERAFAARYVSNPGAGELVKGHRIVLAELGLAPYAGKVVRDPMLFAGSWSKERRAEHLLARLAFVPELFRAAGHETVELWRGSSSERAVEDLESRTFVSTTFSLEVARAHAAGNESTVASTLSCRVVPAERLFMTYAETEEMNRQFLEAEAVLLAGPGDLPF